MGISSYIDTCYWRNNRPFEWEDAPELLCRGMREALAVFLHPIVKRLMISQAFYTIDMGRECI